MINRAYSLIDDNKNRRKKRNERERESNRCRRNFSPRIIKYFTWRGGLARIIIDRTEGRGGLERKQGGGEWEKWGRGGRLHRWMKARSAACTPELRVSHIFADLPPTTKSFSPAPLYFPPVNRVPLPFSCETPA